MPIFRSSTADEALAVNLEHSSTEGLDQGLRQGCRGGESDTPGQEQGGLLLYGRVLVVHHSQNILTQVLESGLGPTNKQKPEKWTHIG